MNLLYIMLQYLWSHNAMYSSSTWVLNLHGLATRGIVASLISSISDTMISSMQ